MDTKIYWSTDKVRSTFIEYFKKLDHTFIPSSSVIPSDDPTLLFTNSGMNQFKPIFLNKEHNFGKIKRAVNSQKCIRAGGKHNDIDDVGKDLYHHTFFEMLGNWSFGDYWKEEAIKYAYELLIKVYKLDPDKIYVSYFSGNDELKLGSDLETKTIWEKYFPSSKILPFDSKDNFWEMGETGPCGPCTEIHYDKSNINRDASGLVNKNDSSVMEIWNIVFIQYNRISTTEFIELSQKHIDTGLGLERLTSILQNVDSNYDIDVFKPIFHEIQRLSNVKPYGGTIDDTADIAYRVIADHVRMIVISISDGLLPGHNKNGNVLRQTIRRALVCGLLDLKILTVNQIGDKTNERQNRYSNEEFLYKIVPFVSRSLQNGYPELDGTSITRIIGIIKEEENKYKQLLTNRFNKFITLYKRYKIKPAYKGSTMISGLDAYNLWNDYGFPIEFMILEANAVGFTVDIDSFNEIRNKNKNGTNK